MARKRKRSLEGDISGCRRYKLVRGKHGRSRGKMIFRCASFVRGEMYPSVPYRKTIGIRFPQSEAVLAKRERVARNVRAQRNVRLFRMAVGA
jgi:hypothetical protein